MSIWTPGGEHEVNPEDQPAGSGQPAPAPAPAPGQAPINPEDLTPEQRAQAEEMAKQLAEARSQILQAEVTDVIANHALGIYELAAIHLTAEEPNLEQAQLAIDALASLVEGMDGKLGQAEPTLKEALQQIRMGFVEKSGSAES